MQGDNGELFVDEDFKDNSALFIDEYKPRQAENENGEMENLIGTPDCWARLQDIYWGSSLCVAAPQQPLHNIVQGEVGDWCGAPCAAWKVLTYFRCVAV